MMVRNCLSVGVKWIDFPVGLSVHFATNQGVKVMLEKEDNSERFESFFYGWRSLFKIKLAALQIISPGKSEIYRRNLFDKQRNIIQPYVRFCERARIQFFSFFFRAFNLNLYRFNCQ